MRSVRLSVLMLTMALAGWFSVTPVEAHHSYAMFDAAKKLTANGTVAKLDWRNPHTYVWVYVANSKSPTGYDLYTFENGSTNILGRLGWTSTTLTAGQKITVDYFPLKDGRTGGHFIEATLADGRVLRGAGGPGITGQIGVVPTESEVKQ